MGNKNFVKTSVNVPTGLANAFGRKGKEMKRAVLETKPSETLDANLKKIYQKYNINTPKNTTNLWNNEKYENELSKLLFPDLYDRVTSCNVKLCLSNDQKDIILKTAREDMLTKAFNRLLLLAYAKQPQNNIEQTKEKTTTYYNNAIIPHACLPKESKNHPETGIYVAGNKKWFVEEFRDILESLPKHINTFVEPFMGSGTVSLESCNHSRFRRIITNDIYWHKANYIRALFHETKRLKTKCLTQMPDQSTYDNAKTVVQSHQESISKNALPEVAANYRLVNYSQNFYGGLRNKRFIEYNDNAYDLYTKNLDFLWNIPPASKNVIVHNEDALNIIRKYNREKHLLFVDPPYPETKGYETDFSIEDFENIAKATIKFNGNFIFCCRITNSLEPEKTLKKHSIDESDKRILHINKYGIDDLHIKHLIDSSFYGHGLFYRDYLFDRNRIAIERVITNFPFTGCYHYDTGKPWQG